MEKFIYNKTNISHITNQLGLPQNYISFLKIDDFSEKLNSENKLIHAEIKDNNFNKYLGQKLFYLEFLDYYDYKIENSNIDTFLSCNIKELYKGIASQSFYPLIKLGMSIEIYEEDEIINSFAFLADSYEDIISSNLYKNLDSERDIQNLFNRIKKTNFENLIINSNSDYYIDNIYKYYPEIIKKIDLDPSIDIQALSELFLDNYSLSGECIFKDSIIQLYYLDTILDYVENKIDVLNFFWLGFIKNYIFNHKEIYNQKVILNLDKLNLSLDDFNWELIIELASRACDFDVLQFTYVCYKNYRKYKDRLYKKAILLYLRKKSII